uniref:Solute carrier family 41 member 1 n=1 Tax=Schistocephalus solidus TaxID=70667 RepID=A0A0V0J1W5_SCHSO
MTTRLSAASTPIVSDGVSNCIHRVRFLSCTASRDEVEFKHRRSPSMNRRISEGSDVFAESSFTLAEDQFTEALSHGGSAEITLVAVRVAISDSVLTGWNLMIACIPLHLILLVVNSALSHLFFSVGLVEPTTPVTAFTPAVIFAHVSASFLQISVLLNFARWLIAHQWLYLVKSSTAADAAGRLASLDLMAISITTGLGDLLGTSLLILALLVTDS